MVVHPGAEEADLGVRVGVACGQLAHPLVDLVLAEAVGQLERPVEADVRGYAVEELVDRVDADRREHGGAVGVGDGGVAGHGR